MKTVEAIAGGHLTDDPRLYPARCAFRFLRNKFGVDKRYGWDDLRQLAWVGTCKAYAKGFRGAELRKIAVFESFGEWVRTYGRRSKWVGETIGHDLDVYSGRTEAEPEDVEDGPPELLEALPPSMARVVKAVVLQGMDHATAGEVLGIDTKSVTVMICRAKKRMRGQVDSHATRNNAFSRRR